MRLEEESGNTVIKITLCGREVQSLEELIKELPADAVASPRRSTVPLMDYWRETQQRLDQLWRSFNQSGLGSPELHFEFAVPVQAGKGKASYTDLMILADRHAVAIEAKFSEPAYESVRSWLGRSPTINRNAVLDGWLQAVARIAGHPIDRETIINLPYQLIHRTASVCCVNRAKRYVVYQLFGNAPLADYADNLRRFATIMAADNRIEFWTCHCAFRGSATYRQLEARWDAGERDLGAQVRQALLAGPLLDFGDPVITPIRAAA